MTDTPRRPGLQRMRVADRASLERAAARVLQDPMVESCSFDVPNLIVEVGLADRVVRRQQDVADWRARLDAVLRR